MSKTAIIITIIIQNIIAHIAPAIIAILVDWSGLLSLIFDVTSFSGDLGSGITSVKIVILINYY